MGGRRFVAAESSVETSSPEKKNFDLDRFFSEPSNFITMLRHLKPNEEGEIRVEDVRAIAAVVLEDRYNVKNPEKTMPENISAIVNRLAFEQNWKRVLTLMKDVFAPTFVLPAETALAESELASAPTPAAPATMTEALIKEETAMVTQEKNLTNTPSARIKALLRDERNLGWLLAEARKVAVNNILSGESLYNLCRVMCRNHGILEAISYGNNQCGRGLAELIGQGYLSYTWTHDARGYKLLDKALELPDPSEAFIAFFRSETSLSKLRTLFRERADKNCRISYKEARQVVTDLAVADKFLIQNFTDTQIGQRLATLIKDGLLKSLGEPSRDHGYQVIIARVTGREVPTPPALDEKRRAEIVTKMTTTASIALIGEDLIEQADKSERQDLPVDVINLIAGQVIDLAHAPHGQTLADSVVSVMAERGYLTPHCDAQPYQPGKTSLDSYFITQLLRDAVADVSEKMKQQDDQTLDAHQSEAQKKLAENRAVLGKADPLTQTMPASSAPLTAPTTLAAAVLPEPTPVSLELENDPIYREMREEEEAARQRLAKLESVRIAYTTVSALKQDPKLSDALRKLSQSMTPEEFQKLFG